MNWTIFLLIFLFTFGICMDCLFQCRVYYECNCCLCTGPGNRPVMSPASSGMPVFSAPGFPPVPGLSKPEVQAVHGNRFGTVPSPAGQWQPQVNGVPASGVQGAQQNARGPPLPTNASPFPQQYTHPPLSSLPGAVQNSTPALMPVGLPPGPMQNAMSAPVPLGPPPAVSASLAQVSVCFCSYFAS